MQEFEPDIDEAAFIDQVNQNLREARFLLLIAGDGIRENAEELLDFLNTFGQMHFVLAFIEMPIYRLRGDHELIVAPRILARTTELQRTAMPAQERSGPPVPPSSQSASESVFYARLAQSIGEQRTSDLMTLVRDLARSHRIQPKMGRGKRLSLNLKTDDDRYNLASIQEDGRVLFYAIVDKTAEIGARDIGIDYLTALADLLNGTLDTSNESWYWGPKINGSYPQITDFLARQREWKEIIAHTLQRIKKAESE